VTQHDEYDDEGRHISPETGEPVGSRLAGPGEDGPEPPEIDPAYVEQEGTAEALARPPLEAVDADDDRWAEVIYHATLVEPYGDTVPRWEQLSDGVRATYREQAHRVRELLGALEAGPEPQRVVLGFGRATAPGEIIAKIDEELEGITSSWARAALGRVRDVVEGAS
jgi:hypothetical protein